MTIARRLPLSSRAGGIHWNKQLISNFMKWNARKQILDTQFQADMDILKSICIAS